MSGCPLVWKREQQREVEETWTTKWVGGGKDKGKVKRKKGSDSTVRLNLPCRFAATPPPR